MEVGVRESLEIEEIQGICRFSMSSRCIGLFSLGGRRA